LFFFENNLFGNNLFDGVLDGSDSAVGNLFDGLLDDVLDSNGVDGFLSGLIVVASCEAEHTGNSHNKEYFFHHL